MGKRWPDVKGRVRAEVVADVADLLLQSSDGLLQGG